MANISMDEDVGPKSKHLHVPRHRSRITFFHHGHRICRTTFLKHAPPGKCRFEVLKLHYLATGLTTRQHGNHNRLPHNALSFSDTQNAVDFIKNYAEANAILLPGRIPGYKRDDLQLLPSGVCLTGCMGPVQACCCSGWNPRCSVQHLLYSVAGAGALHHRDEAHDGLVLGVPAEQCGTHKGSKHS